MSKKIDESDLIFNTNFEPDFLLYCVHFIESGCSCKFGRYKLVQSANMAWNVLLLFLRLSPGTPATKWTYGGTFYHEVLWQSLVKLCTKNIKIHLYL